MTRDKKILNNILTTLRTYLLTILSGFIVPKIMMVYYGSEINGLVSSLTQFISYFSLVEMGLSGAAIYSLYKPLADKKWEEVSAVVITARNFFFKAGYIYMFLTVVFSFIYPFFIQSDILSKPEICILALVLSFSGALEFFTLAKYRVLLTADQKTYVIANAQAVYTIFNVVIITALSIQGWNIILVRIAALFAVSLRSIILYFYCRKHYEDVNFNLTYSKYILDKRWDVFFTQIMMAVQASGLLIIATFITNLKTVSICSVYVMIMTGITYAISVLQSGLTAAFGEIIVNKEINVLRKTYNEFESIYYGIITVCFSTCFVMIIPFIKIYTANIQDVNYVLPLTAAIFVINGLCNLLKYPGGMLIISAGMYKESRWRSLTQTVILLVLGIFLGKYWGINGIVIGIMISHIYRDVDILFFVSKRILQLSYINTLKKWIKTIICFGLSCFPFHWFDMNSSGYMGWSIEALFVVLYSAAIFSLVTFIFARTEYWIIYKRVKTLISDIV